MARRRIVDFHEDGAGQWVADLECGHAQHMWHDPPWQHRPWTRTPEGRASFIDVEIECPLCDRPEPGEGSAP